MQDEESFIKGIEGFWSYAKHILNNYPGILRYHFPMCLKEIEYCYNNCKENDFIFIMLRPNYLKFVVENAEFIGNISNTEHGSK